MNTDILEAVKKLWKLQQLGPEGLWKEPAFDELRKACAAKYQQGRGNVRAHIRFGSCAEIVGPGVLVSIVKAI